LCAGLVDESVLAGVAIRGLIDPFEVVDEEFDEENKEDPLGVGTINDGDEQTGVVTRGVVEACESVASEENRDGVFRAGAVDVKLNPLGAAGQTKENDGVVARGVLDTFEGVDVDEEPNGGDAFCAGNADFVELTGVTARGAEQALTKFVEDENREELFWAGWLKNDVPEISGVVTHEDAEDRLGEVVASEENNEEAFCAVVFGNAFELAVDAAGGGVEKSEVPDGVAVFRFPCDANTQDTVFLPAVVV
jgi:hypothetical protein